MKEKANLEFWKYYDKDGNHTCATDFSTGEWCCFLRVSHFGTREHCMFDVSNNGLTRRGDDGLGSLIPCGFCIFNITSEDER